MAETDETSTHEGCPSRSQAVHGTLCSSKVQQEGGFLSLQLTFPCLFPPPAVLGAAVRRRVRRGDGGAGAQPQPGDRRQAPVLRLGADLAARHQPHELPENGERGWGLLLAASRLLKAVKREIWGFGLSPALERHEALPFSGFAAEKLEFNGFFFFKVWIF